MAMFETKRQNLCAAAVCAVLTALALVWLYSRRGDMQDEAFYAYVRGIGVPGSGICAGFLLRAFWRPTRWFKRFDGTALGTDVTRLFKRK